MADAQQNLTPGIGHAIAQMAQSRILAQRLAVQQQYNQAREQNLLALRQQEAQKIALQQALNAAQIGHYNSTGAEAAARQNEIATRIANAISGGQSFRQNYLQGLPPEEQGPLPNGGNVSDVEDAKRQSMGDTLASMMQAQLAAANGGNPQRIGDFLTQNAALNAGPISPDLAAAILTKTKSVVPIAHGGGVANVHGQITGIMPQPIAAGGSLAYGPQGPMVTAPVKPADLSNNAQKVFTSAANAIAHLAPSGAVPEADSSLYSPFTNSVALLGRAAQQLQQSYTGTNAPATTSPAQGVTRVTSQADYDALPSGSLYIDTDGATKRKK